MSAPSWTRFLAAPHLQSVVAATFAVGVSVPLLAPAPISGDGLEIAGNVVRGGTLHAPGFVLQAWLHVLLRPMSGGDGTRQVQLLCLLGLGLSVYFLCEALRAAGAGVFPRVAAASTFAFFPTVWPLALTPEVFSLAHALLAANVWLCVRLWQEGRQASVADAIAVGVVVGCSAAQHPITVFAAPAFLGSLVVLLRTPEGRLARLCAAAGAFLVVTTSLFASLPLLAHGATWPNWPLQDAEAVVRHLLRADYGTFRLGATDVSFLRTSLEVLVERVASLPLHALAMVMGLLVAWRGPRGVLFVGATALSALGFLHIAGLPPPADPYLERFHGVFVMPAAFLLGWAMHFLETRGPRATPLVPLLSIALAGSAFGVGVQRCDLSNRREQDIYRRALGATLPPSALWLAGNDREVLGGAVIEGDHRYPLNAATRSSRYWRETAPLVEPRLLALGDVTDAAVLREKAIARGIMLVSTERQLVDPAGDRARLRGLFWVVDGVEGDDIDAETVRAAAALCPFVVEFSTRPQDAPGFGGYSMLPFARSFDAASTVLSHESHPQAGLARRIARALEVGDDEETWRQGCDTLMKAAAPSGS
jgi:hypothetical protein